MSFTDIVKPRKDVLSGEGVEGIVDLENLRDETGKRVEARPADFLDLTYPTSDVRFVLENLHQRFSLGQRSAGLYLFEGYKGSGKSHLLLLVNHLATHPDLTRAWLAKHEIACALPPDVTVLVHKFTDFPLHALWDLIPGLKAPGSQRTGRPNLDELRAAVKGRHLFVILDELEMGIRSIPDPAIQNQNLSFLQMLTEESGRSEDPAITVFASIYDSAQEPGATFKRVPRIDVKFAEAADRTKIVRHRLFENSDSMDRKRVDAVIASYCNEWKRKGVKLPDDYRNALLSTYPFSPELIQLIQEQARNLFQGTRGALGLLGAMVRYAHRNKADLVTAAHASIRERSILNRLIDLDPGQTLMRCAQSDLKDLSEKKFADEIVSAVLLATLASAGRAKGMGEEMIAMQVLKPGDDVNEFRGALRAFHKYGTFFHEQEGVFYFDPEEKPNAKVEYKSLGVEPAKAMAKAFEFWTGDLFNDREAVVFQHVDQAQADLRTRDSKRPRFILAPRSLLPEERHTLYFGQANRNLILLLEPRSKDFDAQKHPDILKWAQRCIAATDLQNSAANADRRKQFERIAREDKGYILDAFRKAGLVFACIQKYGSKPDEDEIELEQLGNACSRAEVDQKLTQQFFPQQLFEEHIRERLPELLGKRLKDVERIYRETLGYPVPTHATKVREAVCTLCSQRELGLRHEKDNACGRKPALAENEWPDVVLAEAFEDPKTRSEFGFGGKPAPATPAQPGGASPDATATAGGTPATPQPAPGPEVVHVETPNVRGVGALRQEVAVKLADCADCRVKEITFRIYFEKKNADFASLPAGLRGSLSGLGSITADLTITRAGDFSKSEVESIAESLPSFPDGGYKAEMKVLLPEGA